MNNKKEKDLSLIQKLGYGVGDAGSNFSWTFIASFFLIYCTNTLGISAAVVGTLLMFSKVLDGISDVFMGSIIDKTHHKMGKARFWYFVSAFPTVIFTFILFNIPGTFNDTTKYVYVFIVYTLIGAVFYTMNNIAYTSLSALCTKNPKDRVQMGSFRTIFAIAAVLVMSYVTTNLVDTFGGGQKGWRMVSLIYAAISLVLLLIPVFAVKELPEEELEGEVQSNTSKENISVLQSFRLLLKNKYFIMILVLYLVFYLAGGITSGMGIYFATYQLGNPALLGTLSMVSMVPILIVMPILAGFTSKFGMRNVCIAGHAIGIVGMIFIMIGGLQANFTFILIGFIIKSFGSAPQSGTMAAITAEADEYSYLKYGHRITGTIFSCSSVGIKIGTGLGTALTGFLLDWGGFDGTADVQTAGALATINWSYLLSQAVLPIVCIIIFYFLKVEKENKQLRSKAAERSRQ